MVAGFSPTCLSLTFPSKEFLLFKASKTQNLSFRQELQTKKGVSKNIFSIPGPHFFGQGRRGEGTKKKKKERQRKDEHSRGSRAKNGRVGIGTPFWGSVKEAGGGK